MHPTKAPIQSTGYLASIREFQPMARRYITSQWFRHFGSGVSHTIFNIYLLSLGYSKTVISSILAISSFVIAASAIIVALRPQLFGARAIIELGYTFELGSAIIRILFPLPLVLWLGAVLESVGYSLQSTGLGPLMAEYSKEYERTHLFSINQAIGIIGRFLGSILAGVLPGLVAVAFVLPFDSPSSFQLALLIWPIMVGLSLLPLLSTVSLFGNHAATESTRSHNAEPVTPASPPNDRKKIFQFGVISCLVGLGAGFFMPLLNVFFWEFYDLPTPMIGLVTGLGQFASATGVIFGPALTTRVGKVRAIIIVRTLSLPFLVIMAVVVNPFAAIISYLARSAFMDTAQPIIDCLRMELVHPSNRSLLSASHTAAMNLAWGLGTTVTGPLYDQGVYLPPFWFTVWSYSLSIILFAKFFLDPSKPSALRGHNHDKSS